MREVSNTISGTVFDVQRFSLHDGPGIRTTVFLKGCPLDCVWCHNPEAKSFKPQISFDENKCSNCFECSDVCNPQAHGIENGKHKIIYNKCNLDGACVNVCPNNALKIIGKEKSVDEIMQTVLLDTDYYRNSGGGLTISGGEPMAQFRFTMNLLKKAKKYGLHTVLETCGYGKPELYREIIPYVDLFLFDYKATGSGMHQKLTGVTNELILENLSSLLKRNANLILRCPLIPGVNDTDEHLNAIAEIYKSYPEIVHFEIMPYHNIGNDKAVKIGADSSLDTIELPGEDLVEEWLKKLKSFGCERVTNGS